jgi:hypothetical protein
MGETVGLGAGSGAAVGALTALLDENPNIRKVLKNALIGGAGGAAVGVGAHAIKGDPGSQPGESPRNPKEMNLALAALSGMLPGVGPAMHGGVSQGVGKGVGSSVASILPAMGVGATAAMKIQGGGTPSKYTAPLAMLASVLGSTGAAYAGNRMREKEAKLRPIDERLGRLYARRGECRKCGQPNTEELNRCQCGVEKEAAWERLRMSCFVQSPRYAAMADAARHHAVKSAKEAPGIRQARSDTNTDPTPAQASSGNYAKGELSWKGITIKIENPKGTERRGYDKRGAIMWRRNMAADYGYVQSTKAADGDAIDIFLGPDHDSDLIVVVDQYKGNTFDESKFILAVTTQDQGEKLYLKHYPKGWTLGPVSTTTVPQFKAWLKDGDHKKPFKGQMVKAAVLGFKALTGHLGPIKQIIRQARADGMKGLGGTRFDAALGRNVRTPITRVKPAEALAQSPNTQHLRTGSSQTSRNSFNVGSHDLQVQKGLPRQKIELSPEGAVSYVGGVKGGVNPSPISSLLHETGHGYAHDSVGRLARAPGGFSGKATRDMRLLGTHELPGGYYELDKVTNELAANNAALQLLRGAGAKPQALSYFKAARQPSFESYLNAAWNPPYAISDAQRQLLGKVTTLGRPGYTPGYSGLSDLYATTVKTAP